jgi:hypothetical protein
LIIRYNIGGKAASASNSPGTPVGGSGDVRPGSGFNPPGTSFPAPGGGFPAPGGGQGRPGGGNMPAPGGGRPGGQMQPPGAGFPNQPGAGFPNQPGAGFPNQPGAGFPGSGMPGGNSFGPQGDDDTYETYVIAAVEVLPQMENDRATGKYIHKWGVTKPYNDNASIQCFRISAQSLKKRFGEQLAGAHKQQSADALLPVAVWALNHGMVDECMAVLDDVGKKTDLSANTKKVFDAYTQVRAALAKPTNGGETVVNAWKARLPDYKPVFSNEGHYVLFHNSTETTTPVERRLALLERNMKAFYLWFALKGKVLSVPEEKLVAIQVSSADAFKIQRNALGDVQLVSDGFFSPRDNVVVFSMERTDEAYTMFRQQTQTYWQHGWKLDDLLKGKDAPEGAKKEAGSKKELLQRDLPRMQTLALLEKALEEEAELAAVSHEGSRQLAVATGLISSAVEMPDWLSFGIGSLFETPKGPYVGVEGAAQVAFWPSFGAPNWAYIRQWQKWAESKDPTSKLDDPVVALRNTVQDIYSHRARMPVSAEIDPKLSPSERARKEKELARAKEEVTRARAYAWSLTFYLAKYHLDELLAFYKQMDIMPRDLELDGQTLLMTFARSFKLVNASGDAIDEDAWSKFASHWYAMMGKGKETPPGNDIHLDTPVKPKENNQGAPGFPGAGFPGAGFPGGQPGMPQGPGAGKPGGGGKGPG